MPLKDRSKYNEYMREYMRRYYHEHPTYRYQKLVNRGKRAIERMEVQLAEAEDAGATR